MPLIPPARGTALVRTVSRLAIAKKLVSDQRASKIALEPRPQKIERRLPPSALHYRIISGRTTGAGQERWFSTARSVP